MKGQGSLSKSNWFCVKFTAALALPVLAVAAYIFWTTLVRFNEEPVHAVLAGLLLYFIAWPLQRFFRRYL